MGFLGARFFFFRISSSPTGVIVCSIKLFSLAHRCRSQIRSLCGFPLSDVCKAQLSNKEQQLGRTKERKKQCTISVQDKKSVHSVSKKPFFEQYQMITITDAQEWLPNQLWSFLQSHEIQLINFENVQRNKKEVDVQWDMSNWRRTIQKMKRNCKKVKNEALMMIWVRYQERKTNRGLIWDWSFKTWISLFRYFYVLTYRQKKKGRWTRFDIESWRNKDWTNKEKNTGTGIAQVLSISQPR